MPGYRVLPWEKDGDVFRDPRSFPKDSVVSWSTHDTAPIDAWWRELPGRDRELLARRAGIEEGESDDTARSLALLGDMYGARSDLALALAQELLGVEDRINTPATVGPQNWTWRLPRPIEQLAPRPASRVAFRFDPGARSRVGSLMASSPQPRRPLAAAGMVAGSSSASSVEAPSPSSSVSSTTPASRRGCP